METFRSRPGDLGSTARALSATTVDGASERTRRRMVKNLGPAHTLDGSVDIPALWLHSPAHDTATHLGEHRLHEARATAEAVMDEKLLIPSPVRGFTLHAFGRPFASVDEPKVEPDTSVSSLTGTRRRSTLQKARQKLGNELASSIGTDLERTGDSLRPATTASPSYLRTPYAVSNVLGPDPYEEPSILPPDLTKVRADAACVCRGL